MIGSLFSGIGGLERGLEMCGLGPVKWQAEKDPYASAVLAKHWPTVKRYSDVKEIDDQAERVDIICGGFPCQDISNAGKRAGIDGKRSGLWSEYARVLRVLRPRYALIENVAALVNRGLGRVLSDLSAIGYDAEWTIVSASDAGAPHKRERIFILAHSDRHGESASAVHAETPGPRGTAGLANSDSEGFHKRETLAWKQTGRLQPTNDDLKHKWPPRPGAIGVWDGSKPSFRRGHDGVSSGLDRLRCLGNAVVPQQAALAWKTLIARLS